MVTLKNNRIMKDNTKIIHFKNTAEHQGIQLLGLNSAKTADVTLQEERIILHLQK